MLWGVGRRNRTQSALLSQWALMLSMPWQRPSSARRAPRHRRGWRVLHRRLTRSRHSTPIAGNASRPYPRAGQHAVGTWAWVEWLTWPRWQTRQPRSSDRHLSRRLSPVLDRHLSRSRPHDHRLSRPRDRRLSRPHNCRLTLHCRLCSRLQPSSRTHQLVGCALGAAAARQRRRPPRSACRHASRQRPAAR